MRYARTNDGQYNRVHAQSVKGGICIFAETGLIRYPVLQIPLDLNNAKELHASLEDAIALSESK